MGKIRLLDCTLRDGGHINEGRFGEKVIRNIIKKLDNAGMDIIEVGFLWNSYTDADTARFHTLAELKSVLPKEIKNSRLSLMADNVDLSHLEENDGTVEYIRLSFRKDEFEWAERNTKILKEKGYKVFINPIHGSAFKDEDYLRIIDRVNELKPYGFSIVDTFGALRQDDLGRIYYLIENHLDKDITVGIHLHANLGMAYSLAQYLLNIVSPTRDVVIDGSLYGMGKVPGNLCIEQIMDYMNFRYGRNYSLESVYDLIDDYIMPIYQNIPWGYMIPYAISAQCGVHRTYAEYLQRKGRMRTKDIRRLLNQIDYSHAETFDQNYIEKIYNDYMNVEINDSADIRRFKSEISKYSEIVILAPGASLQMLDLAQVQSKTTCVICVNFNYDKLDAQYCFFTNMKRVESFKEIGDKNIKMMISSNLLQEINSADFVFSWNDLVYHNDRFCEDSTLMLLNLLKRIGINKVNVAGFDGFKKDISNYYDISFEHIVQNSEHTLEERKELLKSVYSPLDIRYLTPSLYEEVGHDKIFGG